MVDLANQTSECKSWVQKHVFDNKEVHAQTKNDFIYINFDNFNQLIGIKCKNIIFKTETLLLNAEKKIILDEYLNLTDVLRIVNFANTEINPMILLSNIIGFNQNQYVKKTAFVELSNYEIFFYNGNFQFYLNKSLISKQMCKYDNFIKKQISYFFSLKNIFFSDTSYSDQVCPFVFLNANLDNLCFLQITNSLIFKNRLMFMDLDERHNSSVDLHIKNLQSLELNIIFEDLTAKILCPLVFKDLRILLLSGSFYSIQKDLFLSFTKIETISLKIDNLKILFQQGIEWMSYLNRDINQSNREIHTEYLNRLIIILFDKFDNLNNFKFGFSDEDLCLFKAFPHKQLVIPLFPFLEKEKECSCTLIWLIKNYRIILVYSSKNFKISKYFQYYFKNNSAIRCIENYSFLFDSCRFEEKFNNCIRNSKYNFSIEFDVLQYTFLFNWLKLIIEVYLKTFASIFGLITSILIIMVIKNTKGKSDSKNPLKNVMYEHIYFNSVFNFIFCLIQSFSLMNICIFPKSSFCSSIYKTVGAQYFKIIFTLFLGNTLRLCCNFSFISFSLSRFYISTSNKKSNFFNKFEKLNLKFYYSIMFVLCSLWSMFKLFEYRPNETFSSFDKNFPYNRYDLRYCHYNYFNDDGYSFLSTRCKIFPILNLINNILNNIIFLILNVIIDILLIRFANKNYKHKKELFHDKKHVKDALEHKKKIRKLLITNGFLYFFSHMPQFLSTVIIIVFSNELTLFCFKYFSCTNILEIFETFSFISICLQFFVFKNFDHNFIVSFEDLKGRYFFRKF